MTLNELEFEIIEDESPNLNLVNNFFETIKPKTLSPKNSNFSLLSTELKLLCVKLLIKISLFLKFIPIFFSNAETLIFILFYYL